MATDPKLEQYLSRLDRALSAISASDRADIILEIKSHVLDAHDRDPSKSIEMIIEALGQPETVANKFLIERGISPAKPPKQPVVKWLTIAFLGSFAIVTFATLAFIWKFTPIIKVDEANNRVQILGGLIDIQDKEGNLNLGDLISLADGPSQKIEGEIKLNSKSVDQLKIMFKNGKIDARAEKGDVFEWKCKIKGEHNSEKIAPKGKDFVMDFSAANGVACDVTYPEGIKAMLHGINGKIDVRDPTASLDVELSNGKVDIRLKEHKAYKFDSEVKNGKVDLPVSSKAPDAIKIKVRINNGKISAT